MQTSTPVDGTAFCPNCFGGGGRTEGIAVYHDNGMKNSQIVWLCYGSTFPWMVIGNCTAGSGGFSDSENVIEGIWDILLMVHTTMGNYGPKSGNQKSPGGRCPGCINSTGHDAMAVDATTTNASVPCCGIAFEGNWLHANQGVWPPSALGGGTTPAQVHWLAIDGNEVVAPGDALPIGATNVVAAAGPRKNGH